VGREGRVTRRGRIHILEDFVVMAVRAFGVGFGCLWIDTWLEE
jgi:hypothetical protein